MHHIKHIIWWITTWLSVVLSVVRQWVSNSNSVREIYRWGCPTIHHRGNRYIIHNMSISPDIFLLDFKWTQFEQIFFLLSRSPYSATVAFAMISGMMCRPDFRFIVGNCEISALSIYLILSESDSLLIKVVFIKSGILKKWLK